MKNQITSVAELNQTIDTYKHFSDDPNRCRWMLIFKIRGVEWEVFTSNKIKSVNFLNKLAEKSDKRMFARLFLGSRRDFSIQLYRIERGHSSKILHVA